VPSLPCPYLQQYLGMAYCPRYKYPLFLFLYKTQIIYFICMLHWPCMSLWITQATLAPPATGKMVKGLFMCYSVIFVTFYSAAVSGYWVFGNKSNSNILKSLLPDSGPPLAPTWVLGLAIIFVLLQLFAIGLVSEQASLFSWNGQLTRIEFCHGKILFGFVWFF